MPFRWNKAKAEANFRKHGVSFHEAMTVFQDPLAVTVSDEEHTDFERRYWQIGLSATGQLLIVVYTEQAGDVIRIITAREVTSHERRVYESEGFA